MINELKRVNAAYIQPCWESVSWHGSCGCSTADNMPQKTSIWIKRHSLRPFINHYRESTEPWWRHEMETFSALLAICAGNSPVPGEFLAQRPVTRSFIVFFYLRLNKRLSIRSWGWWFETPLRPLWRHRNAHRPNRLPKPESWGTWWRHDVETLSALNVLCYDNHQVNYPYKGLVVRNFYVLFVVGIKLLNKQLSYRWS